MKQGLLEHQVCNADSYERARDLRQEVAWYFTPWDALL
jgi:hypothetical protein